MKFNLTIRNASIPKSSFNPSKNISYVPKPIYDQQEFTTGPRPQGFIQEIGDDMVHYSVEKKVRTKKK